MLMGSLGASVAASPIGPKTKVHTMRELELGDDGQDIDGN